MNKDYFVGFARGLIWGGAFIIVIGWIHGGCQ